MYSFFDQIKWVFLQYAVNTCKDVEKGGNLCIFREKKKLSSNKELFNDFGLFFIKTPKNVE